MTMKTTVGRLRKLIKEAGLPGDEPTLFSRCKWIEQAERLAAHMNEVVPGAFSSRGRSVYKVTDLIPQDKWNEVHAELNAFFGAEQDV